MIKVLIVDDEVILRESIKYRLSRDKVIKVIGCAGDGSKALELCKKNMPDIILMDIKMPVIDGIEATRIIKKNYRSTKVVILTTFLGNENISKAIENGADGYVLKDICPEDLINVIKNTYKGLKVVHGDVYSSIVGEFKHNMEGNSKDCINVVDLDKREIELINYIVQGKTTKEIALLLFLSEGRVRNIIADLLKKLNVKDRVQLAVFAVKNRII